MAPLAEILRPQKLADVIGQEHLTAPGKVLSKMLEKDKFSSVILWGPPGTGKTTIVRSMAMQGKYSYHSLNATDATVKDIRTVISEAEKTKAATGRGTFLYVDEIHRFNKTQQDVLLPVVEDGTLIMFGSTTENPKFSVNSTILSRCIVLETNALSTDALGAILKRVRDHYKSKNVTVTYEPDAVRYLIVKCSGDGRKMITVLETVIEILSDNGVVTFEHVSKAMPSKHLVFDPKGNSHFDLASAYQNCIQSSDVDGAVYWLAKWLSSGEDPTYIARRMLITAFEDCSTNPIAQMVAMSACLATERTGMPECRIPLSQATIIMANSKRDKTAYNAIESAMKDVHNGTTVEVPVAMRAGSGKHEAAITKIYVKKNLMSTFMSDVRQYLKDLGSDE